MLDRRRQKCIIQSSLRYGHTGNLKIFALQKLVFETKQKLSTSSEASGSCSLDLQAIQLKVRKFFLVFENFWKTCINHPAASEDGN